MLEKAELTLITMANTSAVYARIDTNLKNNAESILSQLGISPSSAIQMFYSQIVLKKGMPFELKLPSSKPLAVGAMTREELDAELQKGVDSIKAGKVYSADEVDAALASPAFCITKTMTIWMRMNGAFIVREWLHLAVWLPPITLNCVNDLP